MAGGDVERLKQRIVDLEQEAGRHRASARMLEGLISTAPVFILRLDGDARIVFVNRFLPQIRPEDVYGKTVFQVTAPENLEKVTRALELAMKQGTPSSYELDSAGPAGLRARYVTHVAPLEDDDGRVGALLVSSDVTEHMERARKLEEREAALAMAVEATGLGLWSWDTEANTMVWSDRMRAIMGFEEPVPPQGYMECVHQEDRPHVKEKYEHFLATGVFDSLPHRIVRPDGTTRWVLSYGRAMHDEKGAIVKILGGTVDVTAQQSHEAELRHTSKMEAVGQLAAGIAHNFNNMLTAILPTLDLLGTHVPVEDRPLVEGACHAARRAADMVRQLMVFSGRPPYSRPRSERAVDVMQRALAICRPGLEPSIRIEEEYAPGDAQVEDANDLQQALVNVLLNARDALSNTAKPGVLRVSVDYPEPDDASLGGHHLSPDGRLVRFSIADNGRGMTAEVQARMFEPFFTTKGIGEGTGLGLSTAYAIARGRGGAIACRSQVGHGTEFDVIVPVFPSRPLQETTAPKPATFRSPHTIALVEDEPAVRLVIRRVLENEGHRVVEASNVVEALELLTKTGPIHVVLLDRSLPDGQARDVLAALPDLRYRTKVVLFSGHDVPPEEAALVHGVLTKPVRAAEVLEIIAAQLAE